MFPIESDIKMSFPLADPLVQKIKENLIPAIFSGMMLFGTGPANAITKSELQSLTYLQVKGTGLANRCPEVGGKILKTVFRKGDIYFFVGFGSFIKLSCREAKMFR